MFKEERRQTNLKIGQIIYRCIGQKTKIFQGEMKLTFQTQWNNQSYKNHNIIFGPHTAQGPSLWKDSSFVAMVKLGFHN